MLGNEINDFYNKFRLHFFMKVFSKFENREATLTTVESFSMEGIMALGEPTVSEFARMMGISAPNAAYKINSLIQKGYVEKIQSENDHREYHLRPTQKFMNYYNLNFEYLETVTERIRGRFTDEDYKKLESMMHIINTELMPELDLDQFRGQD
ncbi:MAG: MarR family transcriptional regulator [Lachnospiraceae bacterium]|jgi:DNA-binding MarR family transcriptional regulator|nr:MarR family transcriptional regulator [Lachnospiraceae bacterium]MCI1327928.1 MarR family transcriptional regulator [Lachnospiraceae bacterium]